MEDSSQEVRHPSQNVVTYVKRATQFAQERPKTSVALLAGAGIIFVPRLTAFTVLGIGAVWLAAKKTSQRTREMLRERGMNVVQRAKQLMPEKVVVVPTIPVEERVHTAHS